MTDAESHALLLRIVEQMREDFAQERTAAAESRARTHQRIDEVVERLGRIDTSMALAGEVDAQVRRELDMLSRTVKGIEPAAREWSMAKRIGVTAASAMGLTAAGLGAWIAWAGDQAWSAIRHWFRL